MKDAAVVLSLGVPVPIPGLWEWMPPTVHHWSAGSPQGGPARGHIGPRVSPPFPWEAMPMRCPCARTYPLPS